jgi:hypothetical protein
LADQLLQDDERFVAGCGDGTTTLFAALDVLTG